LTVSDILAMTEEDLRIECLQSEIPTSGLDKITIQKQLLEHLGIMTSTPVGHRGDATDNPAVSADLAGAGLGVTNPDLFVTLYSPVHEENPVYQPDNEQVPYTADQSSGAQFRQDRARQTEAKQHAHGLDPPQYSNAPCAELQLQPRRLELEHERKTLRMLLEERERERQEREQEHKQQFELTKLELVISRASAFPANTSAPLSVQSPPFRVAAAIKLIPMFTEHDVETFLISFEKIAELNAFP